MRRHHYAKQGVLALNPKAFFDFFFEPPTRENKSAGEVAIVEVRGPLEHHAGWWCDSYDEILERVEAACGGSATAIVLKLDTPGGDVGGCFETARALREKCAAAGKKLVAYVDGQACSAGYALACSASEIWVPDTGFVGSIGVINTRIDATEADKNWGIRFALTMSGKRKADGHPHQAISEAELAETQGIVDSLAGVFFELVSELRGLAVAALERLEARVFHGAAAVKVGLADKVGSFEALLASLTGEKAMTLKAGKIDEARAALEEAAKGEGEEADKAKRALAAMDEGEEEDDAEGDDAPADDEGEEEDDAEGDDAPADDEKKKKDSAAAATGAVSTSTAADLAATVSEQGKEIAKLKAANEAGERKALLASRPDLDAGLRKLLSTKPLAEVKEIVAAIPKPKAAKPAATATVPATRGAGQGEASTDPTDLDAQMDAQMGLSAPKGGVRVEGTKMILGAMSRDEAAKRAAKEGAK